MDSLYGGKPGISFVLKASFQTIYKDEKHPEYSSMVEAFSQGGKYTDVWYGEFVIIDTPNKNHKDNGKVFRRGLDYLNGFGGAEYIGQIVGPSSGTPYMEIASIDHVKQHAAQIVDNDVSYKKYPSGWQDLNEQGQYIDATPDKDGAYTITDNGRYVVESGDTIKDPVQDIKTYNFNTKNRVLVPGKKTGDENDESLYNDNIRYTWVNIRDDTNEAESWFYVGFEIPYTVIDYTTRPISPYDIDGQYNANRLEMERLDNNANDIPSNDIDPNKIGNHPFWEKWRLNIPKGIKGDSLHNFRVVKIKDIDKIYTFEDIKTVWDENSDTFKTEPTQASYKDSEHPKADNPNESTSGLNDDERQIFVYDYTVYDYDKNGKTYTVYIGDYNEIRSVNVDDYGTITIQTTHDNDYIFKEKIQWLKDIVLTTGDGEEGGHFTFTYNVHDPDNPEQMLTNEMDISWIKSLQIEENGSVIYSFAGTKEKREEHLPEGAKVYKTEEDEDKGRYIVEHLVQWIGENGVQLDKDTGLFTVVNNWGKEIFRTTLVWIKAVTFDEATGTLTFTDTTGTEFPFVIKQIQDIKLNKGIKEDKHIQIQYNTTEPDYEIIGDPINYIQDMKINPLNFHLLVLFSEPTMRYQPQNADGSPNPLINGIDSNGIRWVSDTLGSDNKSYKDTDIYWRDYGSVKDDAGLLVGFNIEITTIAEALGIDVESVTETHVIQYLNQQYPEGLTQADTKYAEKNIVGKIVTVSQENSNGETEVTFYAFDYSWSDTQWYSLGQFNDGGKRDARLMDDDADPEIKEEIKTTITNYGVLLHDYLVNDVTTEDNTILFKLQNFWEYDYQWK